MPCCGDGLARVFRDVEPTKDPGGGAAYAVRERRYQFAVMRTDSA